MALVSLEEVTTRKIKKIKIKINLIKITKKKILLQALEHRCFDKNLLR